MLTKKAIPSSWYCNGICAGLTEKTFIPVTLDIEKTEHLNKFFHLKPIFYGQNELLVNNTTDCFPMIAHYFNCSCLKICFNVGESEIVAKLPVVPDVTQLLLLYGRDSGQKKHSVIFPLPSQQDNITEDLINTKPRRGRKKGFKLNKPNVLLALECKSISSSNELVMSQTSSDERIGSSTSEEVCIQTNLQSRCSIPDLTESDSDDSRLEEELLTKMRQLDNPTQKRSSVKTRVTTNTGPTLRTRSFSLPKEEQITVKENDLTVALLPNQSDITTLKSDDLVTYDRIEDLLNTDDNNNIMETDNNNNATQKNTKRKNVLHPRILRGRTVEPKESLKAIQPKDKFGKTGPKAPKRTKAMIACEKIAQVMVKRKSKNEVFGNKANVVKAVRKVKAKENIPEEVREKQSPENRTPSLNSNQQLEEDKLKNSGNSSNESLTNAVALAREVPAFVEQEAIGLVRKKLDLLKEKRARESVGNDMFVVKEEEPMDLVQSLYHEQNDLVLPVGIIESDQARQVTYQDHLPFQGFPCSDPDNVISLLSNNQCVPYDPSRMTVNNENLTPTFEGSSDFDDNLVINEMEFTEL